MSAPRLTPAAAARIGEMLGLGDESATAADLHAVTLDQLDKLGATQFDELCDRLQLPSKGVPADERRQNTLDALHTAQVREPDATIPWSYGADRITALAVTPWRLFTWWELRDDSLAATRALFGARSTDVALRVYDVTDRIFDGTNAHHHFDVIVTREDRQWFLDVERPGATLVVELGLRDDRGQFRRIARSRRVDLPPSGPPTGVAPEEWMTVHTEAPAANDPPAEDPPATGPLRESRYDLVGARYADLRPRTEGPGGHAPVSSEYVGPGPDSPHPKAGPVSMGPWRVSIEQNERPLAEWTVVRTWPTTPATAADVSGVTGAAAASIDQPQPHQAVAEDGAQTDAIAAPEEATSEADPRQPAAAESPAGPELFRDVPHGASEAFAGRRRPNLPRRSSPIGPVDAPGSSDVLFSVPRPSTDETPST